MEKGAEFNLILIKSIDETLTGLLSVRVVDALYDHLEKVHAISKDEVPYRLETLLSTLEKIFGGPSSKIIGKAVAKKLYAKLGLAFPLIHNNPDPTLAEYIEEAKFGLQK